MADADSRDKLSLSDSRSLQVVDKADDDLASRWFRLIADLTDLADKQLELVPSGPPADQKEFLAWGLFLRGVTSLQAATLLAEKGFVTDCGTISRSILETAFSLGALVADYDLADMMSRANMKVRRAVASEMLALPQELRPQGNVATNLQEFLASSENEKTSLQFQILAEKAGLKPVYTVLYRGLSDNCAHPTANSLERQLKTSEGEPVGFVWGPGRRGLVSALECVSAGYLYILRPMLTLFPSEDIEDGVKSAVERYTVLVDEHRDAIHDL